jgi:hypothetical protein
MVATAGTIAQIGLSAGNPLAVMLGCALIVAGLSSGIVSLILAILVARNRASPRAALVIGGATWLAFTALLIYRMSLEPIVPTFIVALEYSFATAGALAMLTALHAAVRAGASRRVLVVRGSLVAIAAVTASHLGASWLEMERLYALDRAVLRENVDRARELLSNGAARRRSDRPFLQGLLVHAARDVNADLVALLIGAGADVNARHQEKIPLLSALGSDPVWRMNAIPAEVHRRRRVLTVKLLLDRGADANVAGPGGITAAEVAWQADAPELLQLLEEKGATNVRSVASEFEELMIAAAAGDVDRVRTHVTAYGGRMQRHPAGDRAPLVAAAANGRLAVVEELLRAYGGAVKCDLVVQARRAAEKAGQAEVLRRLEKVCYGVGTSSRSASPDSSVSVASIARCVRATST